MPHLPQHIAKLYSPPIVDFKKRATDLVNYSEPYFDLNQAVPNYPPPKNIENLLSEGIKTKNYAFYTPDEGLPEAREIILQELHLLYEQSFSTSNICLTAGANNAFYSILGTITNHGDEIILLSPYYFNHYMTAIIHGVAVKEIELDASNNFSIPFTEIRKSINNKTKAIVLVNPSNPTGKSFSGEEVSGLFQICQENNIFLISDEVYNYFHYNYPTPSSVLNCKNCLDYGIAIHSYSKTFSLTGFRIGFIVAGKKVLQQFIKIQDSNIICAPRLGQLAIIEGIENSKGWMTEKIEIMKNRINLFCQLFNKKESLFSISSKGAFFVYLNILNNSDATKVALDLIKQNNLITLPGKFFGPGQNSSLRLALGNLDSESVSKITNILHNYHD